MLQLLGATIPSVLVTCWWHPAWPRCPQPPCVPARWQVWSHHEEAPAEEVTPVLEEKERSANYKPVFVTEITDELHFYVQDVETGAGTAPG